MLTTAHLNNPTESLAGSDWVNPPLSTRPSDPDKLVGVGAKQWAAQETELNCGPPNRPNFFHADLPILLWNYLAVGDRMRWDSINSHEAGLQIYGGHYITARTVPVTLPPSGTAIPCKICGGPTKNLGADLFECKDKHCGVLTHQATNPGNPAIWDLPVRIGARPEALGAGNLIELTEPLPVDRCSRFARHPETGMVRQCSLPAGHLGRHWHGDWTKAPDDEAWLAAMRDDGDLARQTREARADRAQELYGGLDRIER